MILLLFLAIATISSQETESPESAPVPEKDNEKLIAQLTACWVISIQELSESQQIVNSIILSQISLGNLNRNSIFYKIQTQMLEECVSNAPQEELDNILRSIKDDIKDYKSFKQLIPNFDYAQFNATNFGWNFTKTDETLMKYIRHFESWVDKKNVPEINKESKVSANQTELNARKESVFAELKKKLSSMNKAAKENEQDKNEQLEKYQFYQQKQKAMKDPMNYVYAFVIVSVFALIFLFVYNRVKNANVDPRQEKKNRKKKEQ